MAARSAGNVEHGGDEATLDDVDRVAVVPADLEVHGTAGLAVVHGGQRAPGSTVLAVEAPASVLTKKLKRRGHAPAMLYNLAPESPAANQYGWCLSFTPHALRDVGGGRTALDVFRADLAACAAAGSPGGPFSTNSLAGILWRGVGDPCMLGQGAPCPTKVGAAAPK